MLHQYIVTIINNYYLETSWQTIQRTADLLSLHFNFFPAAWGSQRFCITFERTI